MAFICPQSAVDKLEKEKMPRKGGRWWFSWRRRDFPAEEVGGHSPRGKAGTGRSWSSQGGCSSHSTVPRGTRPQPGSHGGESMRLELEPGEDHCGGQGWRQRPSPSHGSLSVLSHFCILSPEKCPYFTDGKSET